MPLTKLQFRHGINHEVTSYTNEGGWYDCDKVRFRFGFPEKIGGWQKYSGTTFLGACWTCLIQATRTQYFFVRYMMKICLGCTWVKEEAHE
jgi:hypothetical protein